MVERFVSHYDESYFAVNTFWGMQELFIGSDSFLETLSFAMTFFYMITVDNKELHEHDCVLATLSYVDNLLGFFISPFVLPSPK